MASFAAGRGADALILINGLGAGNGTVDAANFDAATGAFAATAELVFIDDAIAGAISVASAAAIIGEATSAYAAGDVRIFVVGNGTDSAAFRFVSAGADAQVSSAELNQVATFTGVAQTSFVTGDMLFG